jgi:uncharacterized protein (TIGR02145 family)
MKRIMPFFLTIFFAAGVFAQGTITVTVTSSEAGSGLTEIEYEFTGDDSAYNITVEVSFNDGEDFAAIPETHLEGALTNVAPGGPYILTWDGIKTFPDTYSKETIIRIVATTTFTCGDDITFTYRGASVTYGTISKTYNIEGTDVTLCWFDRNLGATTDPASTATNTNEDLYGDMFQWGRLDDGHQDRGSTTTSTLSTTDIPGHSDFITTTSHPDDWRNGQNNDLWQQDGICINNPCPTGWHVPTKAELQAEMDSWGEDNQDAAGAFASDLKWPVGGDRDKDGELHSVGEYGYVWSSSVNNITDARLLTFNSSSASIYPDYRALGLSVRCVRD